VDTKNEAGAGQRQKCGSREGKNVKEGSKGGRDKGGEQ